MGGRNVEEWRKAERDETSDAETRTRYQM